MKLLERIQSVPYTGNLLTDQVMMLCNLADGVAFSPNKQTRNLLTKKFNTIKDEIMEDTEIIAPVKEMVAGIKLRKHFSWLVSSRDKNEFFHILY